jgi:uncharacterized membrane protein
MSKGRNILEISVSRLVGLVIFLVLLVIANLIYINSSIYLDIVGFLNSNIGIIILFTILLYLGEVFFIFDFPLNIPAPIFNAIGGFFVVGFIFDVIYLIGNFIGPNVFYLLKLLEPFVIWLVVLIILIVGYIEVFGGIGSKSRKRRAERVERARSMKEKRDRHEKSEKHDWEWEDVKKEIRNAVHEAVGEKETKKEESKKKTGSKKKSGSGKKK